MISSSDWATRMLDRALRKYYGCTYDCEMVGDVAECAKARKAVISLARRRSARWQEVLEDLRELFPGYSVVDSSNGTYGYAYAADIIPYPVTTYNDFEPALTKLGPFVGYVVAASNLCPIYHLAAYGVYRHESGGGTSRWLPGGGYSKQFANYGSKEIAGKVDTSLRSFGYQTITIEQLFHPLPCLDLEYVDLAHVISCMFGQFTFSQLIKAYPKYKRRIERIPGIYSY